MRPVPASRSAPLSRLCPRRLAPLALALALACAASASAETHTWQGPTIGNWSDAGNWSTGLVPNAADDIAVIANTDATGTDIQIALSTDTPVTIGRIDVSNTAVANSVGIGATATPTDFLTLATTSGQPTFSVASGTLKINAPLLGNQGFVKTGAGTLSFRDNLYAQTFTGPIGLADGTLEIGADHDLGDPANDLLVSASTTLLANPINAALPVVLGAARSIDTPTGAPTLTLGNASDAGTLEIAGPLTGIGALRFNAIGTLTLSGANTRSSTLTYQLRPTTPIGDLAHTSELRLVGAGAVRAAGHALTFDLGSGTAQNTAMQARVDLGGFSRSLRLSIIGRSNIHTSSSVLEIANGELLSDGNGNELRLDAGGSNSTAELRLPATTTLIRHSLRIGTSGPGSATATNSARVRIGTNAQFNLFSLNVGENTASGRLDALAPGSTLRLRDGNGTTAMSSLVIGNFTNNPAARADAVLDISDGVIDAQVNTLGVGNGAPAYPATAVLRIGAGTLQAGNLTLGGGNSTAPANFDYRVEQLGGDVLVSGALRFNDGNVTGNVGSRYILRGGTLAPSLLTTGGNFTGTLRPRLEWSGGTLRNFPLRNATYSGPNNPSTPFEIVLSGAAPKTLLVEGNYTMSIPPSFKLSNLDPEVVLSKTGVGTFQFSAQTDGFTGTLRLEAGKLFLGATDSTATLHAGAFVWDAGTIRFTLYPSPTPSNRLELTGALTKTTAPAATTRVLALSNNLSSGTYILATYASTNLTLDDFTVTGVPANTAAEFAIGPTALTVDLHFPAGYTKWRAIYFSSASNLGPAQDLADPDLDGRANLLEYALGTDPLVANSAAAATIAVDAVGRLALSFPRIADPALTYTVRAANDPSGPWSGEGSETVFTSTGAANIAGTVTAPDSQPLATYPRRFLRLFVTR